MARKRAKRKPARKRCPAQSPASRYRILHFVRHGQYEDISGKLGGRLTPRGRRQAAYVARCLAAIPARAIFSSDLGRAVETAEIIRQKAFPSLKVTRAKILREKILPGFPDLAATDELAVQGSREMASIWKRFFKPSRSERHEIVVCHGNVIRALAVMSLGGEISSWICMGTHHCGITEFFVFDRANVALVTYNERGHLPRKLWT